MLMSFVLLLVLSLGGEPAFPEVSGSCADSSPSVSCVLRSASGDSRDLLEREMLEGSLEEDEEEDEALSCWLGGVVAGFGPPPCPIDLLPKALLSHEGSWNQPVRGPPRAV